MQRDAAALKAALADLGQRSLTRRRRAGLPPGVAIFCSNDYLGLKDHPEVVRAFTEAASKYGVGSGASHLVTGHGPEHEALEAELAAFTGRQRALVFLVSDFHLPLADVAPVLASLAAHHVVPVVLWQPAEFALGASHGLARVQEPESGEQRWLWWRPALRERWLARHDERRAALMRLFRAHRLAPLWIPGAFDADAVTRHFLA